MGSDEVEWSYVEEGHCFLSFVPKSSVVLIW
jgi:hypothetical protein